MKREMAAPVANEIGAVVIPVGLAFQEACRQRPGLTLQMGYDDYHDPRRAVPGLRHGVCHALRAPAGRQPYDYFGAIDPDTKAFVQKIADETVKKFFGR